MTRLTWLAKIARQLSKVSPHLHIFPLNIFERQEMASGYELVDRHRFAFSLDFYQI